MPCRKLAQITPTSWRENYRTLNKYPYRNRLPQHPQAPECYPIPAAWHVAVPPPGHVVPLLSEPDVQPPVPSDGFDGPAGGAAAGDAGAGAGAVVVPGSPG